MLTLKGQVPVNYLTCASVCFKVFPGVFTSLAISPGRLELKKEDVVSFDLY